MAEGGAHDRCSDGPRRRWPSGFVGMLAALLVIEAVLDRGAGAESWSLAEWRAERRSAASEAAAGAEILCLGDSLVKTGVIPAALEARLDLPTYNLAAMGNPTPATHSLLRRALAAGSRPRAIVLDAHETQLWSSEYRRGVSAWAGLIGPAEALRLALDDGDPGFFGLYLVHYLVPSIRLRNDLRAAISARRAGGGADPPCPWSRVFERQHQRNWGAVLFRSVRSDSDPDPCPDGELPTGEAGLCYRTGPLARPTNLVYLDRILALAASRGIPVFFVIPPIHPGVLAVRERLGLEAQYLAFLRGVRDRNANVVVVDGRHSGFGHEVFIDACHLDVRGASAFSHALAESMAARLDGPAGGDRWVALPAYAEPTARLAVETLDESQWAVAWQGSRL